MPRDGSNTYTLPETPFVPGGLVAAARFNNNFADLATAMTASFTRAETTSFSRTLLDDADAATARATLVAPPTPTAVPGVAGQWAQAGAGIGAALVLPGGGTWAYLFYNFNNLNDFTGTVIAGAAAGGTVLNAAVPGFYWTGLVWRIA